MKRTTFKKKLQLNVEKLRNLTNEELARAQGGGRGTNSGQVCSTESAHNYDPCYQPAIKGCLNFN